MELPVALRDTLRGVRSVGVITGAGVSAESGIRTYRGQGGLYDDPDEGDRTVDALTGTTLARDPERTWTALIAMAQQAKGAEPNPAHEAIAEIERKVEEFVLLTQNVDGLHRAAGSENVIEIHGSLSKTRCLDCDARGALTREDWAAIARAPRCPECGGFLRPDVVLFGEMLPARELQRLDEGFVAAVPDVVITAGTSALFPYIAQPVLLAKSRGVPTVEVNPERTYLSGSVDYFLQARAGTVLPLIAGAIGG